MTLTPERFDALVIGGGQAGLAAGYWLAKAGSSFVIVDAFERTGDAWRRRWDSLQLFTAACFNALPGLPFPGEPDARPSKDQMADYLERYAERFRLPVRHATPVRRLSRRNELYVAETPNGDLAADAVIVAVGLTGRLRVPSFASELDPEIRQVSATSYRSPDDLRSGPTLVVGAGNTGAEIALELSRRGQVLLGGHSTGEIVSRIPCFGYRLLQLIDIEGWLGRIVRRRLRGRGDPLVRVHEADLRNAGVQRLGRVVGTRDGRPLVEGGPAPEVANVVWCTGFEQDLDWVDLDITDSAGQLRQRRGIVQGMPGLGFVGLRFQSSLGSHLVGGVGRDARHIVGRLIGNAAHDPARPGRQNVRG